MATATVTTHRLNGAQRAALDEIAARISDPAAVITLAGYAGTGKAVGVDSLVQTPSGPRRIGDLRVGDVAFGRDGRPTTVLGVYPQGVRPAFRVTFRDGASVLCDDEHLWAVQSHKMRQKGLPFMTMTTGKIRAAGLRFSSGPHKFCIPLCEPVQYEAREYLIHPYVLGALIGDGTFGGSPTLNSPECDRFIVDRFRDLLPGWVKITESCYESCNRYRLVDTRAHNQNAIKAEIGRLGLLMKSPERFIPKEYLQGAVEQRWELLRGLMDTDGSCRANRTSFATASEQLANDVRTLVQSLGGTAVLQRQARDDFQVNVKVTECPFSLPRKAAEWSPTTKNPPSRFITAIEPEGECEMVCIRVDAADHLFLTDHFIVTHNTYLLRSLLSRLCDRGWSVLLTAPTHQALAVARCGLPADVDAMTIHAALGLSVLENADGSTKVTARARAKIRGYDLIIVDEASMVGQELYQALMRERACAVLFVGDPGQLPPIGERESPAFSEVAHRLMLTDIVRQAEGSALITIAHAIRAVAENGQRLRLDHIRPHALHQAQIQPGSVYTITELVTDARRSGFEAVALTYRNEDVDRINAGVHRALYPDAQAIYAPGERVLFRAPFHEAGREHDEPIARTNELATVLDVSDPYPGMHGTPALDLHLEFDDGRKRRIPTPLNARSWRRTWSALFADHRAAKARAKLASDLDEVQQLRDAAREASALAWSLRTGFANVQHAYALTAHRAQGSTYEIAILHWYGLSRMRDDFEHARAVYVAATRPSQYLVIVE